MLSSWSCCVSPKLLTIRTCRLQLYFFDVAPHRPHRCYSTFTFEISRESVDLLIGGFFRVQYRSTRCRSVHGCHPPIFTCLLQIYSSAVPRSFRRPDCATGCRSVVVDTSGCAELCNGSEGTLLLCGDFLVHGIFTL